MISRAGQALHPLAPQPKNNPVGDASPGAARSKPKVPSGLTKAMPTRPAPMSEGTAMTVRARVSPVGRTVQPVRRKGDSQTATGPPLPAAGGYSGAAGQLERLLLRLLHDSH